jgi:hypothetical protein
MYTSCLRQNIRILLAGPITRIKVHEYFIMQLTIQQTDAHVAARNSQNKEIRVQMISEAPEIHHI